MVLSHGWIDRLKHLVTQAAGVEVVEVNDGFPSQFLKHSVLKRVKFIVRTKMPKWLHQIHPVCLISRPQTDVLPVSIELYWTLIYVIPTGVCSHLSNTHSESVVCGDIVSLVLSNVWTINAERQKEAITTCDVMYCKPLHTLFEGLN